jgi:glycosidase
VKEDSEEYRNFIFAGKEAVVRRWLEAGADGWRLDVADELPDDFIYGLHQAVRETDPNAIVIGEVWEDGSTKIAYGKRRKHLLGRHLDGLMNYPFRTALIQFLLQGDGEGFRNSMETLRENYPRSAFYSAMNSLGTHDTLRILTYLGTGSERWERSKEWRSSYQMEPYELERGKRLLRLGFLVLFSFPGAPTVYYGDEAGMTGYEDPFNRCPFPWGREDGEMVRYCSKLGNYRKKSEPLRQGSIRWGTCRDGVLSYTRSWEGECVAAAVNSSTVPQEVCLPWNGAEAVDVFTRRRYRSEKGTIRFYLPAQGGVLLENVPNG